MTILQFKIDRESGHVIHSHTYGTGLIYKVLSEKTYCTGLDHGRTAGSIATDAGGQGNLS